MTFTNDTDRAPAVEALTDEERDILRQYREDAEELGRRLLYRAHYGNVRAIAEDLIGAIRTGEVDSTDGLDERTCESVDAACTYTGANVRTVYASENWEAGPEELGADVFAGVEDCSELFARLAYHALRADVRERLESLAEDVDGLDLDDEDTYPANAPELDREAVEEAAAREAFVLVWIDAEAEAGRTYPGERLDDIAPEHVPGRFRAWARDMLSAALGATTAGDGIREAWARADAEDLGRALALSCGGWTDGLGEQDLPKPVGLPSMDADGRLWVDPADYRSDVPIVEDLRRIAAPTAGDVAERIRAAIEDDSPEDALELADGLLGGFGVESIDLPAPDDDSDGGTVRYVNLGDTYCATLAYVEDVYGSRFVVADWGSLLEQAEEERTYATGETRCAYCGDWGCEEHGEDA